MEVQLLGSRKSWPDARVIVYTWNWRRGAARWAYMLRCQQLRRLGSRGCVWAGELRGPYKYVFPLLDFQPRRGVGWGCWCCLCSCKYSECLPINCVARQVDTQHISVQCKHAFHMRLSAWNASSAFLLAKPGLIDCFTEISVLSYRKFAFFIVSDIIQICCILLEC